MGKYIKLKNAILCEYVAKGEYSKHTLVNVYSGDVVVQRLPASLSFGIYIEVFRLSREVTEFDIDIKLGRKKILEARFSMSYNPNEKEGIIIIPRLPVNIESEAIFKVSVGHKGARKVNMLSKRIYEGELSYPTSS